MSWWYVAKLSHELDSVRVVVWKMLDRGQVDRLGEARDVDANDVTVSAGPAFGTNVGTLDTFYFGLLVRGGESQTEASETVSSLVGVLDLNGVLTDFPALFGEEAQVDLDLAAWWCYPPEKHETALRL